MEPERLEREIYERKERYWDLIDGNTDLKLNQTL